MYIPFRISQGSTTVTFVITESGTLVTDCLVTYEGNQFSPNVPVPVTEGKSVTLNRNVTGYAEIPVVLNGTTHIWYVDVPKNSRYVEDMAFKRLSGTEYGSVLNVHTGDTTPFVVTPQFESEGDVVTALDYSKNDVWFFATGGVKKVSFDSDIVAALFVPRWTQLSNFSTDCFVVCVDKVHVLDAELNVYESFDVEPGVLAASGDILSNLILVYQNSTVVWNRGTVETITSPILRDCHSAFVAPDNTYVIGTENGIVISSVVEQQRITMYAAQRPGLYSNFDITTNYLFSVDMANRCLVSVTTGEKTYRARYFNNVPRDVVSVTPTRIYVSFFDSTDIMVFDERLNFIETIAGLKSHGATLANGSYYVTNMYANAQPVTLAEPVAPYSSSLIDLVTVNEDFDYEFEVDWPRPAEVTFNDFNGVIRVNGNIFEGGFLRKGDVLSITVDPNPVYYSSNYLMFIGMQPITLEFKVEPKLYPDFVKIPDLLSAFPRVEYKELVTVEGITPGYSASISTTSTEVQFRFAGDYDELEDFNTPFVNSLIVNNGDVLEFRASVVGLLSQRTPHETISNGKVVYAWTVLPMLLEGSTVRSTAKIDIDKLAHLRKQNVHSLTNQPIPSGYTSSLRTPNNGAIPVKIGYQDSALSEDMAEAVLYKSYQNFTELPGSEALILGLPTTVDGFNDSVGYTVHLESLDSDFSQHVVPPKFSEYELEVSVGKYSVLMSSHDMEFFAPFETQFIFSELDYSRLYLNSGIHSELLYNLLEYGDVYSIDADYRRYVVGNPDVQDLVYSNYTVLHKEEIGAVYNTRKLYAYNVQSTSAILRIENVYSIWTVEDYVRQELPFGRSSPVVDFDKLDWSTAPSLIMEFEVLPTSRLPDQDMSYIRTLRGSLREVEQVYYNVSKTRFNKFSLEPVFVHSQHSGYELPIDASGFGTLTMAEDYADELSVNGVFKELGGGWVFISIPNEESIVCDISEVPPSLLRRFGYLGGG